MQKQFLVNKLTDISSTYVSHNKLMTCLQLRPAPSPLRHALRNASLDRNTSVE